MTVQDAQSEALDRGWVALPASYRIPEQTPTLAEALAWCRHLAETHYENFHVASWFLPNVLRPHFHAIYAYCRVSDDLSDDFVEVTGSSPIGVALMKARVGETVRVDLPRGERRFLIVKIEG